MAAAPSFSVYLTLLLFAVDTTPLTMRADRMPNAPMQSFALVALA